MRCIDGSKPARILAMTTREKLMRAVLDLPEEEIDGALEYVASRREDPLLHAIATAPEDDEPFTAEDEAAVAEGRADFAAGRTVSHEEMLRRYG
jgi:predicted transcriptional regulator